MIDEDLNILIEVSYTKTEHIYIYRISCLSIIYIIYYMFRFIMQVAKI